MRQRKKEIDAIVELLEQEHPDVDALASDVWKLIDNFRRDRELFVIAVRNGGMNLIYGPYESMTTATKDFESGKIKSIFSRDEGKIFKVLSPSKIWEDSSPTLFDIR